MPISHFFAEGIGPFKKVHLDLRGPDGHPSLGPHVLAGVNGSGKSTILKAIAWCLAQPADGFAEEDWAHFLNWHTKSRVLLVLDIAGVYRCTYARTKDGDEGWQTRLGGWVNETLGTVGLSPGEYPLVWEVPGRKFNAAAYSSARFVRFIDRPDMAVQAYEPATRRFGFEATVNNDAIQAWLLVLYSKRAIAKERHASTSRYTVAFDALERGLRRVCGEDVSIEVDIEPSFQPRLRIGEQVLNFSQIPDGVKATLGWMADFMMRGEALDWDPKLQGKRPGLLLFDEIEGFLHPLWQRRLLPAVREALPETQSIVTSHSPFVISSCADATIHVLKVNKDGSAYAEPPVPAPIGESITSTLKDIFGVDSRFDVETERLLNEWNELNKIRAEDKFKPADEARLKELTRVLSSRSEELRSIVSQPSPLPKATVDRLTETPRGGRVRRRVATH
jgi:hypothetical protein